MKLMPNSKIRVNLSLANFINVYFRARLLSEALISATFISIILDTSDFLDT